MTIASAGLAVIAIMSAYALSSSESTEAGKRVESDSYTSPTAIARCITYNINKKNPDLRIRNRTGDTSEESIYLILTSVEQSRETVGVIRIDQSQSGSHLTTWLPNRSLSAAPAEIAHKLIAGC